MKKLLGLVVVLVSLSSCSIMVKTPLTRFESPETLGEVGQLDGYIGYQGRQEVELTPNFANVPASTAAPGMHSPGHRLMANGQYNLFDRFDVGLTLPEARLGLKYQIFGDGYAQSDKGNFPLSITAGIASQKEESTSGTTTKFELKEVIFDLAVVAGYRIRKNLLAYGGPFILWDKIRTSHTLNGAAPRSGTGTLRSIGGNAGLELGFGKGFLRAEWAMAKTRLGNMNTGRGTYGTAVGVRF